jgi:hypothetical protein
MKRIVALAIVLTALALAACGTYRPLAPNDAPRLNALFQQRMSSDAELRGDVLQVGEVGLRDRGLDGAVVINGKAWSDKSRSQQERLAKKIGAHMQAALYEAQPNLPRSTFTVRLQNDLQEFFGFILVGGSNDQGIVYRVNR